jgi:hypothetical protein
MTVHEGWAPGRHAAAGWWHRLLVRLERLLLAEPPDQVPLQDEGGAWTIEPFPGPAAGAGHVRVLSELSRPGQRQ